MSIHFIFYKYIISQYKFIWTRPLQYDARVRISEHEGFYMYGQVSQR